jgi:hypothetical protein
MNLSDTETSAMPIFHRVVGLRQGRLRPDPCSDAQRRQDVPKGSRLVPNRPASQGRGSRQLAGILSLLCERTPRIGCRLQTTPTSPAAPDARVIVTGKAPLAAGERTFDRWFDTAAFARPPRGNPGNAPKDVFRGPGTNNWDLSLFKNFPLGSETRIVQFRGEFYNTHNPLMFGANNALVSARPEADQYTVRANHRHLFAACRSARADLRFEGAHHASTKLSETGGRSSPCEQRPHGIRWRTGFINQAHLCRAVVQRMKIEDC